MYESIECIDVSPQRKLIAPETRTHSMTNAKAVPAEAPAAKGQEVGKGEGGAEARTATAATSARPPATWSATATAGWRRRRWGGH